MSFITSAFNWLKKVWQSHASSIAPMAITITEAIKSVLATKAAGFLASIADSITHTNLPTVILADINADIPKVLAVELAIEGLPNNPTPDQVLKFETDVLQAVGVKSDNSKLYTELASQVYGRIEAKVTDKTTKFADIVDIVEGSYQDYLKDLAQYPDIVNAPVGTVLPSGNIVVESAEDAIADQKNNSNSE